MADPMSMSVVSAFGSLLKGLQAIKELAVSVEVKAKVTELYDVIIAGQQSALESNSKQQAMLETISQLKEELARVKAWEEQKKRYKLVNPWEGAVSVVYALKESCKGTEAPHWICAKCHDDGRRTILQPSIGKGAWLLVCPTCKSEIHTGRRAIAQATYAVD